MISIPEICTGHWSYMDVRYNSNQSNYVYMNKSNHDYIEKNELNKNSTDANTIQTGLNFWDISDNLRIVLDSKFSIFLFDSCKIPLKEIADHLGCSYPYAVHLRRNYYSISIRHILKLSELSGISLQDIQNNVECIKSRSGKSIKSKLPIKPDVKIASLVGHVFGDGYIGLNKSQFEYCNDNQNLITQVQSDIFDLFGIIPMTKRRNRLGYPVILGKVLAGFGAPYAPKILSKSRIPSWIKKDKKYASAFLKAFFDDDGSVMFSNSYRAKGINLHIIRHKDYSKATLKLLNDIKEMLSSFEVYSGNPKIIKQYKKPDGNRIVAYINITDIQSIINFNEYIGLTSGDKQDKIQRILLLGIKSRKRKQM